ncbi:hypothetical protein VTH06DRAFT_4940 [Thermothelomyces fergusii]
MSLEANQIEHARVGSWFLGPRAENISDLKDVFDIILEKQREVRRSLYPSDPDFITSEMRALDVHKDSIERLKSSVEDLSDRLAKHSVPFWSPRYHAHMTMETTMASIVGYISAMFYNPNNVASEASPVTTDIEKQVGDQLCRMLGYAGPNPTDGRPASWGHITCGGSVANLEAIWSTRNLKFYPFSLKWAIEEGKLGFLKTVEPPFTVETSQGVRKKFLDLSTWELLNLKPSTVLDLSRQLKDEYSLSPQYLQDALKDYLIQSKGKDVLEKKYGIKTGRFLISSTKHYSWPKGGGNPRRLLLTRDAWTTTAISGIGSDNFVDVQVDEEARMDTADLRSHLDRCLEQEIPVFGVVAIIGSTEHGACDPVTEILEIRTEYQARGLSFAVHCDAAWGGYFASMIREAPTPRYGLLPYVPPLALQPYTVKQLMNLHHADSITIDPHKSGYINYPAGGLCYRDERMRYLVTWTSPYIFTDGDESMGVYGVEGSKPGASAAAAWLTHKTLGLHNRGLGRLLGEAVFTCTKLYCHWATLTRPDDDLIIVPLFRLPSERKGLDPAKVEEEKRFIRDRILGVSNEALYKDQEAWALLETLGGDLMINAFACNFRINGEPNHDVNEVNYLNQRIYERTSIRSLKDNPEDCPIILMTSVFSHDVFGRCLDALKKRLQVDDGSGHCRGARGDMRFLVNVTMSPWPTDPEFLTGIMKSFRQIAEEEVKNCLKRNTVTPDTHRFVLQGLDRVYLVAAPMFHKANRRWQLVLTADFPADAHEQYRKLRAEHPDKFYTASNVEPVTLEDLLRDGGAAAVEWRLDEAGAAAPQGDPLAKFKLENLRVVVKESIAYAALDDDYPDRMPFYLYGSRAEAHLDHVLRRAPNAQISTDLVKLDLAGDGLTDDQLAGGVVAVLDNVFERLLQPLSPDNRTVNVETPGLGLAAGSTHKVTVYATYADFASGTAQPIAAGTVTLQHKPFADWEEINKDGAL